MTRTTLTITALLLSSCGAKTPLQLEEDSGAATGMDAGRRIDAGRDSGARLDAGFDGQVCVPGVVPLVASSIEVVFVIDRSGSMAAGFDGGPPLPDQSRWEILERTMMERLTFDDRIAVGAKFFPSRSDRPVEDPCEVFARMDVPIGPGRVPGVISQFMRWDPAGGTPLAAATEVAVDALSERAGPNAAQFMVIATDGAPGCSPTNTAEADVLDVVTRAHDELGIDSYVLGIASVPELVNYLNTLAVVGGRPRPPETGARFYDAQDPMTLDALLGDIARDLTQCVFSVPVPPGPEDEVEVLVSGMTVPRDEMREDGWDWTSDRRAQLSLFGSACERAIASGGAVRADITCND